MFSGALYAAWMAAAALVAGCTSPIGETADTGKGAYVQSFALQDPSTGQPLADRPYAVIADLRTQNQSDGTSIVLRGTTDASGRTAVLHFEQPIANYRIYAVERIGNGVNGRNFVVTLPDGVRPAARQPYFIDGCDGRPAYKGYTDANGSTVYLTSDQSCVMRIRVVTRF